MTTSFIETEQHRKMLLRRLEGQKLPFTVSVSRGKKRSFWQNRLNRLWAGEIAEQLGDRTPEEVRGELKLTFGVPILCAENEAFCEAYDKHVRPLPYETKLAIMREPLDFPVTRLMKTDQQHRYLEAIFKFYTEQGVILTVPEDKRFGPAIGERIG